MKRKSSQKCFCVLTSVWTDPSFHRRYCYCTLPRLVYSPENLISLAETESQVEVKAFQFICSRGGKCRTQKVQGSIGIICNWVTLTLLQFSSERSKSAFSPLLCTFRSICCDLEVLSVQTVRHIISRLDLHDSIIGLTLIDIGGQENNKLGK